MQKKYQVFVSSTYEDLIEERQEVMHALLELNCIPSGMELFPAANETQWNLIKKVIDDCDYYILIIGGRYGSIGPDGISYTEMEYKYAEEIAKPIIAFLPEDPGKIISDKTEHTEGGKQKLEDFKIRAQQKLCKVWHSPEHLGSVVSRSLIQLISSNPAIGWVKANEIADEEATSEILSLRKQLETLQNDLLFYRKKTAPDGTENLAQGDQVYVFDYILSLWEKYSTVNYKMHANISWNEIFNIIAPLMINEANESKILETINKFLFDHEYKVIKEKYGEDISISKIQIKVDHFHTIMIQLRALGLISKSEKNRSIKDHSTYWTLTPYGDELMTRYRAIKKDQFHDNQK